MTDENTQPEEKAFIEAKRGFELFGEPLHPWGISRKIAGDAMGKKFPHGLSEGDAERVTKTMSYAGMFLDVIIVCWLCSLKDPSEQTKEDIKSGAWNPSKALRTPDGALEAAIAWAEKHGMAETKFSENPEECDVQGKKFIEAKEVFFAIVTGEDISKFRIEVEKVTGESGDESSKV